MQHEEGQKLQQLKHHSNETCEPPKAEHAENRAGNDAQAGWWLGLPAEAGHRQIPIDDYRLDER